MIEGAEIINRPRELRFCENSKTPQVGDLRYVEQVADLFRLNYTTS